MSSEMPRRIWVLHFDSEETNFLAFTSEAAAEYQGALSALELANEWGLEPKIVAELARLVLAESFWEALEYWNNGPAEANDCWIQVWQIDLETNVDAKYRAQIEKLAEDILAKEQ